MAGRFHPDKWELHASGVNTSTDRPDSLIPEGHVSEAAARQAFAKMRSSGGFRYTSALILPPAGSASEEPIYLIKPPGA